MCGRGWYSTHPPACMLSSGRVLVVVALAGQRGESVADVRRRSSRLRDLPNPVRRRMVPQSCGGVQGPCGNATSHPRPLSSIRASFSQVRGCEVPEKYLRPTFFFDHGGGGRAQFALEVVLHDSVPEGMRSCFPSFLHPFSSIPPLSLSIHC
jgi:hypothetical protein